jgi:hypothetical protein
MRAFGLDMVSKKRSCSFCQGQMNKDDMMFEERVEGTRLVCCLRCGLPRIKEINDRLDEVQKAIHEEMKNNPDRYVRTAVTAKR